MEYHCLLLDCQLKNVLFQCYILPDICSIKRRGQTFVCESCIIKTKFTIFVFDKRGGLAQLARALAWHARGHRFDSDILHNLI